MIGTNINHYHVLRQIGRGGMGVVYEAQDQRLGRRLALKFLPESAAADPNAWERFQQEATTLSGLNHPHILTIYDVGSVDGRDFIATELIEGATLRERLEQGPLPLLEAIKVTRQVLEALKAAHLAGIVHRDLKPENVMIRNDGYVKVLDFGVAKLIAPRSCPELPTQTGNLTSLGEFVGTPQYMAPEQLRGEAADERTDLFALGILFYEMLTGKHPWQRSNSLEVLHGILYDEPDLSAFDPNIASVLNSALQKQPSRRFQSAAEILEALQNDVPASASAVPRADASIAVLPFRLLGGMEERQALSLGFADALITALGTLNNLIVRPTSSIIGHTETADPLRTARELRVRYILDGAIQKLGSDWRVSIQLFDADSNRIVFSHKYDFTMAGIFEIQDEISSRVAIALQTKLGTVPQTTRERYSKNTQAYNDYLQGLRFSYGEGKDLLERGSESLQRAVTTDPQFALAHAMLSQVSLTLYYGHDPRRQWLMQAETSCKRALELDPDLAEALMAKAFIVWSPAYNFQHREALVYLQRALSSRPNLDHALNRLGTICSHIGHMRESRAAYLRAREVNPFSKASQGIAQTYLWSGEWDLAAAECDKWIGESRENKYAWWIYPQPALLSGDIVTAKSRMAEVIQNTAPDPLFSSLEAMVHAWSGEREPALNCIHKSCESAQSFGHNHHIYHQIASAYSLLGEGEKAMPWLERAVNTGFPCWSLFRIDPSLEQLRSSRRFQELVSSLEEEYAPLKIDIP